MWYNGDEYYPINKWVGIFNRDYKGYGIKVKAHQLHQLFNSYNIKPIFKNKKGEIGEKGEIALYPVILVNNAREMKTDFMYRLTNILEYGVSSGVDYYIHKPQKPYEPSFKNGENDMEKYSQHLINKDNYTNEQKTKRVVITEEQYKRLIENVSSEGFSLRNGEFKFMPHTNKMADTHIFSDDSSKLNVKEVLLPKSGVMSYNLYDIKNMNVNKALKHLTNTEGENIDWFNGDGNSESYSNTIMYFIKRTCQYMKKIIGDQSVDYITYPQSSSYFNELMTNALLRTFPQSDGIKLIPKMLVKNVRGIFVNTDAAKSIGLSNNEIISLMRNVEKWKKDEDIRDLRHEIEKLQNEVEEILKNKTSKRGRPSNDLLAKQKLIDINKEKINTLRGKGKDPTVDSNGKVKDFQIKSLDDRTRRAIEGLFTINPEHLSIQSKLRGKTIVLFDDNISSGATMDDLCLLLQKYGVAKIIPITLGTISPTIYKYSDRKSKGDA